MHPATDPARVAAARSGDRQALESLLTEHLPLIYGVVRRALGADPDVDDVVQETMLRAVRHLRGLRDPEGFKSWGRHVRDCGQCTLAGRHRAPAAWALAAPWLLPVPAALAGQVSSLAATAAGGGLGSATVAAVADSVRRALGYVNIKSAGLVGAGMAGATALTVLAVHTVTDVAEPVPTSPPGLGAVPAGTTPAGTAAAPSVSVGPAVPAAPGPVAVTAEGVTRADLYVAPDGDDAGPGTVEQPFATLGRAVSVVRPGQVIALRAGTYRPVEPVEIATNGTEQQRITVSNLVGERPVIDATGLPAGGRMVTHTGSHWTVQGLEIKNAPSYAYVCRSCRQNVFRRLWVHDNGNTGLVLYDAGTVGNQVLDSDFSRNHDTVDRGGDADGLSIKSGSGTGNVVRGCRFAENSGDGLDLSAFADPVTVTSNWAYGNGHNRWQIRDFNGPGNGVKLGGGSPAPSVDHVVTDNASWDNAGYGFTEAGNQGRLTLTNNTAYRNGGVGFAFVYSPSRLRNNLALANARDVQLGTAVDDADNSWRQTGWATTVLRSGDATTARGERTAAGLFPPTTFLLNRKDTTMGASMTATGGTVARPSA